MPAAPVGLSTRKLGIGVGAFAAIGVALGELVYGRVAAVILLGVGFLSLAVNGVRNRSETRRFNRDSPAMLARVARGEFAEAQDFFWRWSEQTRTPDVSAVARLNLGWILLLQGELHQASAVLGDSAERYSVELREQKLLYRTRIVAALADALRGDRRRGRPGSGERARCPRRDATRVPGRIRIPRRRLARDEGVPREPRARGLNPATGSRASHRSGGGLSHSNWAIGF